MAVISKIKLPNSIIYDIQDKVSGYATVAVVEEKVAELVNSAPDALNTLNELAVALGNDPNFATTVTNELSKKTVTTYKSWTSADIVTA